MDLTNRCNLTCPVCFANANAAGYLYEPDFDTVRKMLQALRDQRPVAGRIVQFSGGEPTIYPRFLDALRMAKEMGFSHTQVATNGLKFTDLAFAEQCKEAGLHTLYLQFDGVCDDVYRRTRGESLWEKKLQCIENVKKAGLKIVFVPTIVKGLNDHEIGDIVRLALEYIECTSGISFQPVAFTGRIARHELEAEALHALRFRPRGPAADRHRRPLRGLVSALLRHAVFQAAQRPARRRDNHPQLPPALLGGHLSVCRPESESGPGDAVRRSRPDAARYGRTIAQGRQTPLPVLHQVRRLEQPAQVLPRGESARRLTFTKFLQTLQGMTDKSYGRGENEKKGFTYRTLMLAGMHFMDSYNYDVERVKRCVIHYAAPERPIYPFCAYNSGPVYREKIEREFAVPLETTQQAPAADSAGEEGPVRARTGRQRRLTSCHHHLVH